jgi:hypothetical protein
MRSYVFVLLALFGTSGFLYALEAPLGKKPPYEIAIELPVDLAVAPAQEDESLLTEDERLEAYIQGVVDTKYAKYHVIVAVRNGHVLLSNLPRDTIKANKIITYVKKFSSLPTSRKDETVVAETESEGQLLTDEDYTGIWLPQSTVLFPAQVANPRNIAFSVGPRVHDVCGGHIGTAFSFGDQFPIYRWANIWKWHGDLQLEAEAGAFCVFNHDDPSFPMQNADYYAGIPISYAVGPWAFRARFYHISSHLGDEYMEKTRHVHRKNRSFEAVDFFTAYQIKDHFLVYGGPGCVVHSDDEMHIPPLYFQYGLEVRAWRHNFTQLYGQPFFAMHFCNAQEHHFNFDTTYALGYEWGKLQGFGRKIRLFVEYHDGYSPDGQFCTQKTNYLGLVLSFGF